MAFGLPTASASDRGSPAMSAFSLVPIRPSLSTRLALSPTQKESDISDPTMGIQSDSESIYSADMNRYQISTCAFTYMLHSALAKLPQSQMASCIYDNLTSLPACGQSDGAYKFNPAARDIYFRFHEIGPVPATFQRTQRRMVVANMTELAPVEEMAVYQLREQFKKLQKHWEKTFEDTCAMRMRRNHEIPAGTDGQLRRRRGAMSGNTISAREHVALCELTEEFKFYGVWAISTIDHME